MAVGQVMMQQVNLTLWIPLEVNLILQNFWFKEEFLNQKIRGSLVIGNRRQIDISSR